MDTPIYLNREDFECLAARDIGPRIRYIRNVLYEKYGEKYSSKNVVARINVISAPAYSAIELGKTKDCPSKVLFAISKDFQINMTVFSDDYYLQGYKPIVIGNPQDYDLDQFVTNTYEQAKLNEIKSNPFTEKEFHCIVRVELQASNGDTRDIYYRKTREKINRPFMRDIIAGVEGMMGRIDALINPSQKPTQDQQSPLFIAEQQIQLREEHPTYIGWKPKYVIDMTQQLLQKISEKYSTDLHNLFSRKRGDEDGT